MLNRSRRPQFNRLHLFVCAAAAATSAALAVSSSFEATARSASRNDAARPAARREPTSSEVAATLRRVGLGPEELAAAGVGTENVPLISAVMRLYLTSNDDIALATRQLNLALRVSLRPATVEELHPDENDAQAVADAAVLAARPSVAECTAALTAALDDAYGRASMILPQNSRDILDAIRARRFDGIGIPYAMAERSTRDSILLRGSLAAKHWADASGGQVSEDVQARIAAADAHDLTSTVASLLEGGRAQMRAAWSQEFGGE